jgi:hypothetical protein
MRKWGVFITLFYALVVVVLLVPGVVFLVGPDSPGWAGFYDQVKSAYSAWGTWVAVGVPVIGQALLLFLRVDTSFKRLKPRAHILTSATTAAFFLALLTFAGVASLRVGFKGDNLGFLDRYSSEAVLGWTLGTCGFLWLLWGIVFYRFSRNSGDPITRMVSWLLRGSVLELLIAVPAHVIVRRRHDCSAPIVTSFGITSGVAIMLLSFGPSVLLLYKKRMETYSARAAAGEITNLR